MLFWLQPPSKEACALAGVPPPEVSKAVQAGEMLVIMVPYYWGTIYPRAGVRLPSCCVPHRITWHPIHPVELGCCTGKPPLTPAIDLFNHPKCTQSRHLCSGSIPHLCVRRRPFRTPRPQPPHANSLQGLQCPCATGSRPTPRCLCCRRVLAAVTGRPGAPRPARGDCTGDGINNITLVGIITAPWGLAGGKPWEVVCVPVPDAAAKGGFKLQVGFRSGDQGGDIPREVYSMWDLQR